MQPRSITITSTNGGIFQVLILLHFLVVLPWYATELEKNKVFVRGLPFSATEADLRGLFGQHGELRNVCIVTFRNGKSKGLAYVEYEKEYMHMSLQPTMPMKGGDKIP